MAGVAFEGAMHPAVIDYLVEGGAMRDTDPMLRRIY
jgi:hypothetical protein